MVAVQTDSQIVAGEGGGGVAGRNFGRIVAAEGENAEGAAELGLAEGGGFGFAEGAEFAGAALDRGAGDFACERGGFGAGTLGKRENVQIGEGKRLDKGKRGGVVVFGFAGKAGDEVGAG